MNFTDKEIDGLIKGVFDGEIDKENLPENLYTAIAEFLQGGLYKGFGGSVADFGGTDLNLLQELRTNIYMFSAAKTYQEVRSMTDLMYEGDNLKPFKDFYEDAKGLYDTYNKNYAETEYNTAVASAEMGAKWNDIIKDADLFPLLKMTVVEDAQTTEICEPLDGITLPINDPFWDEFYPPNHWNCRSTVLQLDEGEVSSKSEVSKAKEHADEDMQDVFKMNVGKDEFVFSPEHPYFTTVPKEDRELAKENFGLPLPEDLIPKTLDERIENIKQSASDFDNIIKQRQKDFDERLAPIQLKIDEYKKKLEEIPLTPEFNAEYSKISKEYLQVSKEFDIVNATRGKIREGYNNFVTDLLESKNGKSEFAFEMTKAQSNKIINIKNGEDYFKRIVGKGVLKDSDSVGVKIIQGRENYNLADVKVKLKENSSIKTITHELGHYLEHTNKDYFDKIKEFYAERTKGDKIEKLSKIYPKNSYSSKEITKKDNFMNAYTGKYYEYNGKQYATEITSMWFSEIFGDLNGFIKKDPEYFEFVFKLFNK